MAPRLPVLQRFAIPRLSVRARLGLIQVLLLAALLVVGGVSADAIQHERAAVQAMGLLGRAERLHLDADEMHDALHVNVHEALRADVRDAAATARMLAAVHANVRQLELDLGQLDALPLPAQLAGLVARNRPAAVDYGNRALALVELALRDRAQALAQEQAFADAFDALLKSNDHVSSQIATQVQEAEQAAIDKAAAARNGIIATGIAALLVAWACIALIARSVRRSLHRVSEAARALAAGNLSVRSEVATQDEVGELAGSLNRMADELQAMIDRLLADADRDAFTAKLTQALEMAESERDVHAVVRRAMGQLPAELPMELLLAAEDQPALRVAAEHPRCGRAGCSVEVPGSCAAIRRGTVVVFEDSDALDACPRLRDRPGGPLAAVCVPVTFMGGTLGVLHAAGPVRRTPGARLVAQISALGVQSGARIGAVRAFARANLHAYTDVLTGLANRRALESMADGLRDAGTPFAFALADLDHFKRLNDAHGHDAGDRALKLFADVLRQHLRQDDVPARWGGEEFAVVFRRATASQAAEVLERVRGGLAEALLASGLPPFTASFGIAESAGAGDAQQLLRAADEALYISKAQGRDRISYGVSTTLRQSSSLPLKMR